MVGVADDLLYISQSREDLQCQLYLQHSYANQETYKVRETKAKTMHFNAKKQSEENFTFNDTRYKNLYYEFSAHIGAHIGMA